MNNASFSGRLTKDPIVRKVPIKGVETSVVNFTLAVDDGYGAYRKTDFVHVTAWRGAADTIGEYMSKGREMKVWGSVHLDNYKVKSEQGVEETRWCLAVPRPYGFEFGEKRIVNEATDNDQVPFPEAEE